MASVSLHAPKRYLVLSIWLPVQLELDSSNVRNFLFESWIEIGIAATKTCADILRWRALEDFRSQTILDIYLRLSKGSYILVIMVNFRVHSARVIQEWLWYNGPAVFIFHLITMELTESLLACSRLVTISYSSSLLWPWRKSSRASWVLYVVQSITVLLTVYRSYSLQKLWIKSDLFIPATIFH